MLQVLLLTVRVTLALYDGDPFVKSPHSFSDIGPHGTSWVAVEFYAGWCGHCQAFAPTWKEAARHACAAAPRLMFVAVDCASDFLLCQEMRVPSFPHIRLFGPGLPALGHELSTCLHGCKTSAEVLDEVVHLVREVAPSLVREIDALPTRSSTLGARVGSASTKLAELSERSSCAQAAARPALPLAVYSSDLRQGEAPPAATQMPVPLADLVSAVLYGLQRELLRLPLDDAPEYTERRAALIAWLQTLAALFPGARNRDALGRLSRQVASTPRLDASTWRTLLLDYDGPMLPQGAPAGGIAWSACRGWSEEARGYPCGLWLLFHTLLAQANDAQASAALRSVRGYVRHFFGCDTCRAHFLSLTEAADDPLDAATSADSAVLWLWRAHNRVNWRLNQSGSEAVAQLGLLKTQFPSPARCPGCRAASGKWREASLLRHLRASYCIEARLGSPCRGAALDYHGASSLRLGVADAEEVVLLDIGSAIDKVPVVFVGALVAAALLVALHCRAYREKKDRKEQTKAMAMTPVNEYSWDGEGSDGERTGTSSTLPLLQRKVQDISDQ